MPRENEKHPMNEIVKVKLSVIDPESTVNVRRHEENIKKSIERVKLSIEKKGYRADSIIVLRPHPNSSSDYAYENVTGQCRAEACRQLVREKIPAIIEDLDDDAARKRSFEENDKRTPLSPNDYTRIVEEKFNEFREQGCTVGEAYKKTAEFWNISVTKAKEFFLLGDLPESVKKNVENESLPPHVAAAIVKSSANIANEEEKKKKMEEKAEFFGKQEKKDKAIAKKAILESGSNATPEELDKKMEELGSSGKTLKVELEEGDDLKLQKWGVDKGGALKKAPLSVVASQLINETLGKYRSARDGNKQ